MKSKVLLSISMSAILSVLLSACSSSAESAKSNITESIIYSSSENASEIKESSSVSSDTDASGSVEAIKYSFTSMDYDPYNDAASIAEAGDTIVLGKVKKTSFAYVDDKTGKITENSSALDGCIFNTIFDIEVTECYKGDVYENMRIRVYGGLEGQYIDEQREALGDEVDEIPIVAEKMEWNIETGKEYLFVIRNKDDGVEGNYIHLLVNPGQGAYPTDEPLKEDSYSISAKKILQYLGEDKISTDTSEENKNEYSEASTIEKQDNSSKESGESSTEPAQ